MMSSNGSAALDITLERLKQLNRQERILIGLYFYERLSIDEIAVVLQKSNRSVQSMLEEVFPKLFQEVVTVDNLEAVSQKAL